MTELVKIDAAKAGGTLSKVVHAARELVEQATDDIVRDLVQVQATQMIEEALTPEVKALMLAAGKAGQYEIITAKKGPLIKQEQIISVCVQAYVRGLSLSGQEFAIFPKRDGEVALYVKSNGYRHLFARSERGGEVSVAVGYPEIRPLVTAGKTKDDSHDGSGKAVALMAGKASVVWDCKPVSVEAEGDYRIGIPCYTTDNIDGLQAKAERRLLMRLWTKCSGVREADPETTEEVEAVEYTDIEDATSDASVSGRDWKAELEPYREEWKLLKSDAAKSVYTALMFARTEAEVVQCKETAAKTDMSVQDREKFQRAAAWQDERLAAGGVL